MNGMNVPKIALPMILVLYGFLCNSNPVAPTPTPILYPLANGNSWKYTITISPIGKDSVIVESVSSDTLLSNENWFFVSISEGNRTRGGWYRNRGDGTWTLLFSPSIMSSLLYKYPATVNELYVGGNSGDTVRVVATNEQVQTPAGTFLCVVYQREVPSDSAGATQYISTFIAPNIGKIKEEIYFLDETNNKVVTSQYTLVEYILKNSD